MRKHKVTVTQKTSKCGALSHSDLAIACSCGELTRVLSHGTREEASKVIFAHRVAALEAAVGVKFTQEWESGT